MKIRKTWISAFDIIKTNPVVILPFIFVGFFEALAVELIYFSTRKPLSTILNPLIIKFFGENLIHYPGHLLILPNLFYYTQLAIYIFIGVFMSAVCVNIVKNIKSNLPVIVNAIIKNTLRRYLSYIILGTITVIFLGLIKNIDTFVFAKFMQFVSKYLPGLVKNTFFIGLSLLLFLSNIILYTFLILTIPFMVIEKKSFLKAFISSIYSGFRNFFTIFALISLPFLVYFPLMLLKGSSTLLADRIFPEINIYITTAGIIVTIFVDCFIAVCASIFLIEKGPVKK